MFVSRDTFFDDVAAEVRKLGGIEDDEDGGKGNDEPIEDDGRTAGIFGGQESGGKPNAGTVAKKPGDMIKDIKDLQRASKFF